MRGEESGAVALGIESHSGWAAVVALGGPRANPRVLLRGRIELADPADGDSKQPYHAAEDMPLPRARAFLASREADARRRAGAELKRFASELSSTSGSPPSSRIACAVLTAASSSPPPLQSILASHALVHAAEGDHFRDAVADAAGRAGWTVVRVRRKELAGKASETLGRPAEALQRHVADFRRTVGPPWGADQKIAALAAWTVLSSTVATLHVFWQEFANRP